MDPFTLGSIASRLDDHDRRLSVINGSQGRMADELTAIRLAIQKLGDQAEARDKTVVATAVALKEAEDVRRSKTEEGWAPWTRVAVVCGGVGVVLSLILSFYLAFRHNTITQIPPVKTTK